VTQMPARTGVRLGGFVSTLDCPPSLIATSTVGPCQSHGFANSVTENKRVGSNR
jgi:hypothetical protein